MKSINVIGGGMAGCEASWMLAKFKIPVKLFEMRPVKKTEAHQTDQLAELVCSNSLGSDQESSSGRMLKDEMRHLGSLILEAAEHSKVPAGRALGVDRIRFGKYISEKIESNPYIEVIRDEITEIPKEGHTIVATGPLTSESLSKDLAAYLGKESLYFYDSISPIVMADSVDLTKAFFGSRYEPENHDYLNCPLDKEQYEQFISDLLTSDKVEAKDFEALKCFEGCMPIEVSAARGPQTLSFGPMKPVGLHNPHSEKRPYAVLQLRKENEPTTMYNLVGFQTRMKWGEQKRIFQTIPGLEKAEFVRMGSMHRNTYIESPEVLDSELRIKGHCHVQVAGQLTGVEGYVESAATGQWTALFLAARLQEKTLSAPPRASAMGALIHSVTHMPEHGDFAPMNMNFGILPPLEERVKKKRERRQKMAERAWTSFEGWSKETHDFTSVSRVL